jgi:hypothetical protein
VLSDPASPTGVIPYLRIRAKAGSERRRHDARVIATGRSKGNRHTFNSAVAFADGPAGGRAIAQSTFHHVAD